MPNPFAHVELSTDDVKKAKKFYSAVFAWELSDLPAMNYTMIGVGGGVGGGLAKIQSPAQPPAWLPYVQVDDVKATIAKAVKGGATVLLEYQEIGDMGSIGIFVDPQGARLGLWAAKAPAEHPAPEVSKPATKKAPSAPAKKTPPEPAKKASKKTAPAPTPTPTPAASKKTSKKTAAPEPAAAKKSPSKKSPAPPPAKKGSKKR